jgi:hypothetical protein
MSIVLFFSFLLIENFGVKGGHQSWSHQASMLQCKKLQVGAITVARAATPISRA